MATDRANQLLETFTQMETDRQVWETNWEEVSELVLPQRPITSRTRGDERRSRIFDATPVFANEMFAAQLSGQLINPELRWFSLRLPREDLSEDQEVHEWLTAVSNTLMRLFRQSTFNPASHEMFLELGAFGTGAFFVQEDSPGELSFMARPLAEIYVRENARNGVDAVGRKYSLSLRQALRIFGEGALPDSLKREAEKAPDSTKTFIHLIQEREDFTEGSPNPSKMRWESVHMLRDPATIVRESGFNEFPFMIPRWIRSPSEAYGRGPGLTTLPDNRMLQRMKEVTIRGAQKVVEPPLVAPDDGMIGPIRTIPGGINFQRAGLRRDDQIRPLLTGAQPEIGEQLMEPVRQNILRAFYIDPQAFQPPEPRVTATAVVDNRDARFQRMAPMIARIQREFLAPLIDRVFARLQAAGRLPDPPPDLPNGQPIDVDFVSPAAMAQRVTEADNMTRFLSRIAPLLEADPAAVANLDIEEYIRTMGRNLTVPPEILRDPQEAREAREALAQQQQASERVGRLREGAEAGERLSQAVENVTQIRRS